MDESRTAETTVAAAVPAPSAVSGADKVGSLVQEFYEERGKQSAAAQDKARKVQTHTLVTIVATLFCVAVWVVPSFLKLTPEPVSVEVMEQGTRVTLYLASIDVSNFRASNGRLPAILSEAGVDDPEVTYTRTSDSTYNLTASVDGRDIVYESSMGRDEFLGSAKIILERR